MANRYKFYKDEHMHTLDGRPLHGTSSVMSVLSKPLTYWAVGEGLKTIGWYPINEDKDGKRVKVKKEIRQESAERGFDTLMELGKDKYLEVLDGAYYAHSKTKDKAADAGTLMHERMEKFVKTCIEKYEGKPIDGRSEDEKMNFFIEWSQDNLDKFLWSEAHTYSENLWCGGISDVGAKMKDGRNVIIDFKSSKTTYSSQFYQIGGYDLQISENGGFTADGDQIFQPIEIHAHAVIPFGAPKFFVEMKENHLVELNKKAFTSALSLLQTEQQYKKEYEKK